MHLTAHIRRRKEENEILLMTHIVVGYPSLEASYDLVGTMVESGVDLMELQIPFSEPIADGPVILRANQDALAAGATVDRCLAFAGRVAADFAIPFVFMTYYNILYKRGVASFARATARAGLHGAIVPDLPPEEGAAYLEAMGAEGLDPILIFAPTSSERRMAYLARHAGGFVYCVARKGVTGAETAFGESLEDYLDRCRRHTDLPLAVGFGVRRKTDVDFLRGRADIAVVGTETIRALDRGGLAEVGRFLGALR